MLILTIKLIKIILDFGFSRKHFSTKSTSIEMIVMVKASLNEEKLLSTDLSAGLEFAKEGLR